MKIILQKLYLILPNRNTNNLREPLVPIILGTILKYVLGGRIFDLIGHILIFVGCLNTVYFLSKEIKNKDFGSVEIFILLGVLFTGIQIILISLMDWLGIKTLL